MKNLSLALGSILFLILLFNSCAKEDLYTEESPLLGSNVYATIDFQNQTNTCEELLQKLEVFTPDTKEELAFLDQVEDPAKMSKEAIEAYGKILGFKDLESFEHFFWELDAHKCDFSSELSLPEGGDQGGDQLVSCIFDVISGIFLNSLNNPPSGSNGGAVFIAAVRDVLVCIFRYDRCRANQ